MRALSVVLVGASIVALGCGGAKRGQEVVGNRAAPPPKPACTEERLAQLAEHLQARWNTPDVAIVRCTPGLFPTAGFFLETDDKVGIVAPDGTELVPFAPRGKRMIATDVVECATVDLNGDGVDEIVETWRRAASGRFGSSNWLEVRRIDDRTLTTITGPHTSVYHPDLGACTAEVRLAGRTIVIEVDSPHGIPPSDCLAAGTHAFALEHDALVEITAPVVSRR